jgi:hypothetical protein
LGPGVGRSHLNSAVELSCSVQTLSLLDFSMPLRSSPSDYCATVRILLHSPTVGAAVPLASVLLPPPPVSWRFSLLAPRASAPTDASHCLAQRVPKCCAPCTSSVLKYSSPSLLMRICGSLSPEFLRPGCKPTKHPASRLSGTVAVRPKCGQCIREQSLV